MRVIKRHKIRVHMCLNYLNFYWKKYVCYTKLTSKAQTSSKKSNELVKNWMVSINRS
jgi:hypothetical protein